MFQEADFCRSAAVLSKVGATHVACIRRPVPLSLTFLYVGCVQLTPTSFQYAANVRHLQDVPCPGIR